MARPFDARRTRVRGRSPVGGDRAELAARRFGVVRKRLVERVGRIAMDGKRGQRPLPVARDYAHPWVATAPTPARTQGVTAPMAKYFD